MVFREGSIFLKTLKDCTGRNTFINVLKKLTDNIYIYPSNFIKLRSDSLLKTNKFWIWGFILKYFNIEYNKPKEKTNNYMAC